MTAIFTAHKKEQLEADFLATLRHFVEAMYEFDETVFNQALDSNTWSGAELCSHVVKSLEFIHQKVNGIVRPCERNMEEHITVLRQMMEDMDAKGKSAEILLPAPGFKSRTEMRIALTQAAQALLKDIKTLELTALCQDMDFPGLGQLTRYEVICFAAFHMDRHRRQLLTIHHALGEKS